MKKKTLLLLFPLLCHTVFAQQKEAAEKLVEEGIAYHDKGDYEGAVKKYDKALELDKDNLLALAEKAMSLLSLEKYNETIRVCQNAINKHKGENGLRAVYVTYGNAYDGLLKTDKAIEIYDEGIQLFPGHYQLYFNKGVTLASVRKYEEALTCFQRSASLNPGHGSSNNAIGRLLDGSKKRIPALLAYSRFLVIEPTGRRAEENFAGLKKIMKANVEQTGEKSISINFNAGILGDTTAGGKPKENSFATAELVLSLSAALDFDDKNKDKTEVEKFTRKFESICQTLKETQKDNYGFYWDYYVPYFIEMKDKNLVETFAHIAFVTSGDPDIEKWLQAHKSDLDKFYEWSNGFTWKKP